MRKATAIACLYCLMAIVPTACSDKQSAEEKYLIENAESFAEAYFNYDLNKALDYCTPESRKYLSLLASNIREDDLEILRSQDGNATVEFEDIEYSDNDSIAFVRFSVKDYMDITDIEKKGHIVKDGIFQIQTVLRNGRWYVRMEGLPRSERRSLD